MKFVDSKKYFYSHTGKFMLLTVLRRWSRCCSYSVWLYGLYYGALHVLKSYRALCPRVSSFLLALWSPRLGKRELVCVRLVQLFLCFVRVSFCHFSLSLSIGGWLRFVIVALTGWHSLDFSTYLLYSINVRKMKFISYIYTLFLYLYCSLFVCKWCTISDEEKLLTNGFGNYGQQASTWRCVNRILRRSLNVFI